MGRDRGIPYVKFHGMIRALKRDYPQSFVKGPGLNDANVEDAVVTWDDEGSLLLAFPCHNSIHQDLYGNGKLHRHLTGGGFWFMVISSEVMEVRSQ